LPHLLPDWWLQPLFAKCADWRLRPAAAELRVFDPSLIDKTIDPCENFYRYSCNEWFKRNPLPPTRLPMAASPSWPS